MDHRQDLRLLPPDVREAQAFSFVGAEPVRSDTLDPTILDRFLTPITTRESLLDRQFLETARPFTFDHGALRLQGYEWGDRRAAAVLLVHGWGGRASQFQCVVPRLVDRGLHVLAFDAPAHGRSQGNRTSLFDFAGAVGSLAAHFARPLAGLLGHSMGAASATIALWRGACAVRRMVLVAPICRLEDVVRRFVLRVGLSGHEEAALKHTLARMFGSDIWQVSSLAHIGRDMKTPALILHDRDDAEIPYQDGFDTAAAWSGSHFGTTSGLGHRTILRDPAVLEQAVSFLCDGNH